MEITPEQKLNTHKYYLWILTCQIPKMFWNTPEEEQFFHAQTLTGFTVEKTDWDLVYGELRVKCPVVWNHAIFLAKSALGIE